MPCAVGPPHICPPHDAGQTGAGKTHTLTGGGGGLTGRAIEATFRAIEARSSSASCTATATCSEIYNEQVFDLFVPKASSAPLSVRPARRGIPYPSRALNLRSVIFCVALALRGAAPVAQVRKHPVSGFFVDGLTTQPCTTAAEALTALQVSRTYFSARSLIRTCH